MNIFATSSSSLGLYGQLGDYALIKSGVYKKLTNAYYEKQNIKDEEQQTKEKETINKNKLNAEELLKSSTALTNTNIEDKDKLVKNLESFVEDYNNYIKSSSESDNKSLLRQTLTMINEGKSNSGLLSKAGITINSDNTLSLDSEAFKNADKNTINTLFKGKNSFIEQIQSQASRLFINATNEYNTYNEQSTYNKNIEPVTIDMLL